MAKRKILFVVNVDWFFLSHRLPIAQAALKAGYEVHVAVGITDKLAELQSHGFIIHPLTMARGRSNLKKEFASFCQIIRLFKHIKPDLVHLVTIKPVLFGGIAARITRVPAVVVAISGLGFIYVARGARASLKRFFVGCLYKLALTRPHLVAIFQNTHDQETLCRLVKGLSERSRLIQGSGIDLKIFAATPLPQSTPVVLMACRLIADKGVWEFVQAARLIRQQGIAARFWLAGAVDPDNPVSLTATDMKAIAQEAVVELLGQREDMESILPQSHIVVLPSYYGEGLPKILIEAAACARAIITTDMPGCRNAITPNVTGLLVPARDAQALAGAMIELLNTPKRCDDLGKAGRVRAERHFDINQIVTEHMQIYTDLFTPRI